MAPAASRRTASSSCFDGRGFAALVTLAPGTADGDCAVAEGWRAPSRRRETCATRSGRSAATGRRREAGRLRCACDWEIQRRGVGVAIRGRGVASEVLLGRLHRCDGEGRLMLRVRELLDVVLQRVELAPQAIDFLVLRGALRVPLRRGGRLQL